MRARPGQPSENFGFLVAGSGEKHPGVQLVIPSLDLHDQSDLSQVTQELRHVSAVDPQLFGHLALGHANPASAILLFQAK